jgi:hypothetical protein
MQIPKIFSFLQGIFLIHMRENYRIDGMRPDLFSAVCRIPRLAQNAEIHDASL